MRTKGVNKEQQLKYISDPTSRLNKMPIKHEIVKLEVTPDVVMADNLPEKN